MKFAMDPAIFRRLYGDLAKDNPMWEDDPGRDRPGLQLAEVDLHRRAAVLRRLRHDAGKVGDVKGARALGIFGDSVTTDHICPAGSIKPTSPAGMYLLEQRRARSSTSTATARAAATTR